jgi:hypothetical protein
MNTPTGQAGTFCYSYTEEDFTEVRRPEVAYGPQFWTPSHPEATHSDQLVFGFEEDSTARIIPEMSFASGTTAREAFGEVEGPDSFVPDEGPSAYEVTAALFRRLLNGPDDTSNHVFDLLLEESDPNVILDVAFESDRRTGGDRALCVAESVLRALRDRAWPALEKVSKRKESDCFLFIGVIADCPGIDASKQREALANLAQHPDREIRFEVLEKVSALPGAFRAEVLNILSRDPDSAIRQEALAELDASD